MTPNHAAQLFPTPPTRTPDLPAYIFGCQILAYILSADMEVYGLLTDEDLKLAEHSAYIAVCAPEILPIAVDTISAVRHRIAQVLKCRDQEHQDALAALPDIFPTSEPLGGRKVPLQPPPPALPPEGMTVDPYPTRENAEAYLNDQRARPGPPQIRF